jgi:DNA-binding MarR family transcriptional regulator
MVGTKTSPKTTRPKTTSPETTGSASAGRTIARLAKQVEVALGPLQLSLSQYRTLGLLDGEATGSSMLADQLAVRPPSVTGVVDGLVARELVERVPDPGDRRRHALVLTEEGRRLLADADRAVDERLDLIAGGAGAGRTETMTRGFRRWSDALDRRLAARLAEQR